MISEKINSGNPLNRLKPGSILLRPLVIRTVSTELRQGDAQIEAELGGVEKRLYTFIVEAKRQSTPIIIQQAINQAKAASSENRWPLILVPYLSAERLAELERQQISGVDLCGNGVVIVPGSLYILRTGQPNLYPDSRPLNNPYAGRSAIVARALLKRVSWPSLNELAATVKKAGCPISLSQASKAVQALSEDLIVSKQREGIAVIDRQALLEKLGAAWRKPQARAKLALRLAAKSDWAKALTASAELRWALTGESSVIRYTTFGQSGPQQVAVSNLSLASGLLGGKTEPVPNFADIELWETDEDGFFFDNETDSKGVRWASRMQTWLELQAGDARQREAAQDLRRQLLTAAQA